MRCAAPRALRAVRFRLPRRKGRIRRRTRSFGGRNTLLGKQPAHRVGWLRAFCKPRAGLLFVDDDRARLSARIVVPENFYETAVTRRALIGHHETIRRLFLGAHAPQSNLYHRVSFSSRFLTFPA